MTYRKKGTPLFKLFNPELFINPKGKIMKFVSLVGTSIFLGSSIYVFWKLESDLKKKPKEEP